MKYYTRLNTADGHKAVAVEGRKCSFLDSAFTYKDEKGRYQLIDESTGLALCFAKKLKDLEPAYRMREERIKQIKTSPKYETLKHNFEMLKKATQNEEFGKEAQKDAEDHIPA